MQLLARPVSEEEFRQMAYLKDSFFELGMTTVSHPKCLVESDQNGTIVFEFGLDAARQCTFTNELYKSAHDPKTYPHQMLHGHVRRYVKRDQTFETKTGLLR